MPGCNSDETQDCMPLILSESRYQVRGCYTDETEDCMPLIPSESEDCIHVSVNEGHIDKVLDHVSDATFDAC